jgi:hypothetical protein
MQASGSCRSSKHGDRRERGFHYTISVGLGGADAATGLEYDNSAYACTARFGQAGANLLEAYFPRESQGSIHLTR